MTERALRQSAVRSISSLRPVRSQKKMVQFLGMILWWEVELYLKNACVRIEKDGWDGHHGQKFVRGNTVYL